MLWTYLHSMVLNLSICFNETAEIKLHLRSQNHFEIPEASLEQTPVFSIQTYREANNDVSIKGSKFNHKSSFELSWQAPRS